MKKFALIFLIFSWAIGSDAQDEIKNYRPYFAAGNHQGKNMMVLREFEQSDQKYYLIVDPQNLETQILKSSKISVKPISSSTETRYFKNSPYSKAIQAAKQQSVALQDAGITHGIPKEKGIALTIDLCPSHKGLETAMNR